MKTDQQNKAARDFVRRIIETKFGQKIDDETLDSVANKVLQALPDNFKEPQTI